jgi:hypothetical protein
MRNALAALSADASVGNSSTYRLLTSGVCSFHQRWIPPAEDPNVGPTLPLFALRCADEIPERPGNRISRTAHRVKPSAEGSSRKDCPMSPLPEGSTSVRSCAHFCSPLRGDHRTPGSASYYPQARSWCFGSVMLIGLPFWKLPITSRFQPPAHPIQRDSSGSQTAVHVLPPRPKPPQRVPAGTEIPDWGTGRASSPTSSDTIPARR